MGDIQAVHENTAGLEDLVEQIHEVVEAAVKQVGMRRRKGIGDEKFLSEVDLAIGVNAKALNHCRGNSLLHFK